MKTYIETVKKLLKICEVIRIKGYKPSVEKIRKEFPAPKLEEILDELKKEGYINDDLIPTEKGRSLIKIGLTGGTFDIIHIGHLKTLEEAKKYVDLLAVVVARDKTVKKMKNREPLNNEEIRLDIVSMLRPVDVAILGSEEDFMEPVRRINPDIIFLGYDQELPQQLRGKLGDAEIIKLDIFYRGYKSSRMIKKLLSMLGY